MWPPPFTGLASLDLSYYTLLAFVLSLQGVVAAEVSVAVPYPALSAPTVKVATLPLLRLLFAFGVVVDGYLPPIWEAFAWGKR